MTLEMREPTFVILSSLAAGPRHGYGIITDAAALTDDTLRLQAGTLYAALDRLRVDGLVEVASEEIVQGRLRRSFALTENGRARLSAEAERRRRGAETALRRLRVTGVGA
ncbi:PadR family transcriptional regulator [Frondihabitans peucedani]|jgi:DNA-binding PadR family transcriptional regulator|uniref:Transcription regulator PadR N-terminal domain-containing protein n=1 Tax=Frondihabitans peucedani TaxID=598626 RepID=A0ABP8DXA9_9MICO